VFLCCVIYSAAALLITWPLITQISTYALGAGYGDQFENIRLSWWTHYALQHGFSPFYQTLLGYPDGFFSATQWTEPLTYWPAALLSFVVTPVAAYNLCVLISLVLSGLAAFYLCWSIAKREPMDFGAAQFGGALLGGLIYMAYPAVQGHISGGHIGILTLYALPIYALCLWRIMNVEARRRTILIGAAALWITALGNLDLMLYTLFPLTLFYLGYYALFRRIELRRAVLIKLVRLFIIGGVALIPFFAPLFFALIAPIKTADLQETGWVRYSADPLSFVSPSPFTPWGARLAPDYTHAVLGTNSIEGSAYSGVIAILLSLIGIAVVRKAALPWLSVAIGAMIFSLGPLLKWGDQPVIYTLGEYKSYVLLPWAWLQHLPVLSASRTPGRFNLTTGLMLALLASMGASVVLRRITVRGVRIGLCAVLLIGILFEYQLFFPAQMVSAAIAPYIYTLADRSDVRAVFDVPWDDPLAAKDALYLQIAHHKPLIAGYVARATPVDPAKLNVLQSAVMGTASIRDTALLSEQGIDMVIVHLAYLKNVETTLNQIAQQLGSPAYRDDRLAIFNVARTVSAAQTVPDAEFNTVSDVQHANWMYLYTPKDAYVSISANLTAGSALYEVDGQIESVGQVTNHQIARLFRLARGFHTVKVTAEAANETMKLSAELVDGQPIAIDSPLRVIGYRSVPGSSAELRVDLIWQASQKLDSDDHFFVHLTDSSGKIIAQYDGQPDGGAYPTTQWQADQIWSESIALALPDVPPGTYQLYTGWYRYPDMQRLPVNGDTPGAKDGLLYLGRIVLMPSQGLYF